MTHARSARTAIARNAGSAALATMLLIACGGAQTGPPSGGGAPVTATMTADGGAVEATSRDGTTLRLAFPAGAVLEPLEVTLTPMDAEDVRARFMIEPFATRLGQPIEIRLTVAPGTALADTSLFLGSGADRVPLPSTIDAVNGVISASTRQLGFAFGADATTIARLQARSSGPIDFADVSCTIAIGHLSDARTRAAQDWLKTVASAQAIRNAYLTMLTACDVDEDDEASFQAARDFLQEVVCDGYRDARVNTVIYNPAIGNGTPEDFWRLTESLVSWAASIQLTGAECATPTALEEDLEDLYDAYVDDYAQRLEALDIDVWRTLWNVELANVVRLLGDAEAFGLASARTRTEQVLVTRLFERLRTAAYERCREDQTQGYLADIRNGGGHIGAVVTPGPPPAAWLPFDLAELDADIQLCASQLSVAVFDDVPVPLPEQARVLGGGTLPGDHDVAATVKVPHGGALQLTGDVRALRCATSGSAPRFADETLALVFGGTEVGRLTPSNGRYFAQPVDLPIAELLAALGLPDDTFGTFLLEVRRDGNACDDAYGERNAVLFELTIDLGEPFLIEGTSRACAEFYVAAGRDSRCSETAIGATFAESYDFSYAYEYPTYWYGTPRESGSIAGSANSAATVDGTTLTIVVSAAASASLEAWLSSPQAHVSMRGSWAFEVGPGMSLTVDVAGQPLGTLEIRNLDTRTLTTVYHYFNFWEQGPPWPTGPFALAPGRHEVRLDNLMDWQRTCYAPEDQEYPVIDCSGFVGGLFQQHWQGPLSINALITVAPTGQ